MKSLLRFSLAVLWLGLTLSPAQAAFTSMYVFGDSVSSTTGNVSGVSFYYGKRYSNGRVWVEVLAQHQVLTLFPTNNTSYFDNTSGNMVAEVNNFIPPADASNALVVVWVNNADFYDPVLYDGTSLNLWTNVINQSQTNHFRAITNLYAKGIRTLVMPNMVDVSMVPFANSYASTNFVHQRCLDYNLAFYATLDRARTSCPGLTIYVPDYFAMLTNMLVHPASYGVTNALSNGRSIDAVHNGLSDTNGPGASYIYWDPTDPTAKVHNVMASIAQQLISPVKIGQITVLAGSNRLDILNVPVGQSGQVLGCPDLASGNWTTNITFPGTNTVQSVFVPVSGPQGFYQLNFPVVWTWP